MILKPCPHCGAAAIIAESWSYKTHCKFVFVRCTVCAAESRVFSFDNDEKRAEAEAAAAHAWNMRVND